MFRRIFIAIFILAAIAAVAVFLQKPGKTKTVEVGYDHDHFVTMPKDIARDFEAFTVSFDSDDDDDGDGKTEARGVAEWVAYEVKRFDGPCVPTGERPRWFSDEELVSRRLAPRDESYSTSSAQRGKNGFDRGHLAPKFLAARVSPEAERNTHTLLNAVPQRHEFNAGIWLDLERLTGAWAQRYGMVWVITGPIFDGKKASAFLGETRKGEFPVAIPDALYKILVRDTPDPAKPEALAFVYRQEGAGYGKGPFSHTSHLVAIDEIERATGLNFLTSLENATEESIEARRANSLWPVSDSDFIRECRQ